jgi:hypothetical protein
MGVCLCGCTILNDLITLWSIWPPGNSLHLSRLAWTDEAIKFLTKIGSERRSRSNGQLTLITNGSEIEERAKYTPEELKTLTEKLVPFLIRSG